MGTRGSQFEQLYGDSNTFRSVYHPRSFEERLFQPSILVSIAALLVTSILWLRRPAEGSPLDAIVTFIPYRLLYSIENWLHPPLAPRPMLVGSLRTRAAKKDLLVKILGIDTQGGGIMGSVSQASQRGLTSMSGAMMAFKGYSDSPPGLGNLDNSCYQNSILQGLASLRQLPPYLSEQLRGVDLEERKNDATVNLRALIADLNSASNNGRTIWTPPALKNMSTWQQQDAQEYFSKLLDEVDKEIAKFTRAKHSLPCISPKPALVDIEDTKSRDDSGYESFASSSTTSSSETSGAPRNPLEGLVAQRVACVQCGHSDGLSMIPFNCLTLSLGINVAEHDLYELLDAYSHIESIEGVQCGKCTLLKVQRLLNIVISRGRDADLPDEKLAEPLARLAFVEEALEDDDFEDKTLTEKCKITSSHKVNSTKTKQTVIARAPQSLAVHMNRSVFDENTGAMWKNIAAVRFPLLLDLGPWCLGSSGTFTRVTDDSTKGIPFIKPARPDEEEWLLNPRSSMIAGDRGQSKISGPLYELSAVVTHYGRHENGHYVCYRKFPRSSPPEQPKAEKTVEDERDGEASPTEGIELESLGKDAPAVPAEDDDTEMDWWRLSDETVYKVPEEQVLSQGGVFMLFYDCVEPKSVLTSEAESAAAAAEAPISTAASTAGDVSLCNSSAASEATDEPVTPTEPVHQSEPHITVAGSEQPSPVEKPTDVTDDTISKAETTAPESRPVETN